jgi:hypothetical protein
VTIDELRFTYRSARSTAITTAISAVVVIESVAVHFAVAARHPALAWTLTLASVAAILWLIRDYSALGTGAVAITGDQVHLMIGRRFDITIPLATVARVVKPTFRDLPTPGTNQGRDYLNLTKPAAPNVLIVLDEPRRVRLTAGIHRDVQRLALKLDDPAAFLVALDDRRRLVAPA